MHPFFAPLSEQETVLLLTTLTVGGSDHVGMFAHLPDDLQNRLREKAQALLNIPSEKRVKLMVHELKNAMTTNGLRGIERMDPSWLIHGLKGESARVVGTVLLGLPGPVVRSVLKRLPKGIRKNLPARESLKTINPELLQAIRVMFESRFHPMPVPPTGSFRFRDIIHLERVELFTLMRDLGLVELGQAFVSVGKMALVDLCRRLPRDKQEELILAVRAASRVDLPDTKSAHRFLSRVVVNFENTEEFFQKSGLWRLAKASLLEEESFRLAFMQRLPRGPGLFFEQYVGKAQDLAEHGDEALMRLQDSIMVRVQELSRRGVIGARWRQLEMAFHDPEAPQKAELERRTVEEVAEPEADAAALPVEDRVEGEGGLS